VQDPSNRRDNVVQLDETALPPFPIYQEALRDGVPELVCGRGRQLGQPHRHAHS
jgi:hypothetical protein